MPGYVLFILIAGYTLPVGPSKITLQLNANNLLDKIYYNPYGGSGRNYAFAAPRGFLGSIRVEF